LEGELTMLVSVRVLGSSIAMDGDYAPMSLGHVPVTWLVPPPSLSIISIVDPSFE